MSLLPRPIVELFSSRGDGPLSFEALWREAQTFSPRKVEIESPPLFGRGTRVLVRFNRPSGSCVDAVGVDEDPLIAFDKALKEARVLLAAR